MAAVADPEQQLAWEARQRTAAGAAGVLAGVASLAGDIWSQTTFRDVPRAGFLESLGQAGSGPIGRAESVRTAFFQFYDDNATAIIGSSVLRGVGLLALAWAVTFLAAATRARRPEFPKPVVYATLIGAVLTAIAAILGAFASSIAVSDFLAGPRTVDAAAEVSGGSLLVTAQIIQPIGQLALAAGLFLTCLNAQRVGLLTRFLGILGMITAFLIVFPIGPGVQVVQAFWLVALGLVILGAAPGGTPPAWRTGKAEPWPSQQETSAARRRQAEARRGGPPPPPEEQPEPVAAGRPHPSSKKRKRKRRD